MSVTINGTTGLAGVDGSAGTPAVQGSDTNTGIFFPAADTVGVTTGGTERMRIDSSGNVGIGTTTMTRNTNIGGSGAAVGLSLQNSGTSGRTYSIFSTNNGASVVGALSFYDDTASAYRMVIDSSGNLLVGTATNSFSSTNYGIVLNPNNESFWVANTASNLIAFNINTNNNIFKFFRSGTQVGAVSVTTTNTTYGTSSDYRLKHDVAPMTGALAKVAALKPVTYKWNVDASDGEGFIAHELAEVIPQAVVGEKDAIDDKGEAKYQNIDTSFLVATLTAAIQELKALTDAQASTITALTARITALEAK